MHDQPDDEQQGFWCPTPELYPDEQPSLEQLYQVPRLSFDPRDPRFRAWVPEKTAEEP